MDDRKTAPPRTASRTVAIAAVALLIAIAIAGIVLGTVRHQSVAPAATDTATTQGSDAPPTPTVDVGPNAVLFAASSDQLSPSDFAKMEELGKKMAGQDKMVVILGKMDADTALARRRTANVRVALLKGGVPQTRMQIEIFPFPPGPVAPRAVDRVEVVTRDR
jgi:outer membrane protein OmpA-like peptidoglycan-associated protein